MKKEIEYWPNGKRRSEITYWAHGPKKQEIIYSEDSTSVYHRYHRKDGTVEKHICKGDGGRMVYINYYNSMGIKEKEEKYNRDGSIRKVDFFDITGKIIPMSTQLRAL